MDVERAKYHVGLSLLPGIGPVRLRRLVESMGSAEAAWRASPAQLRRSGVEDKGIPQLLQRRREIDVDVEASRITGLGGRVLIPSDDEYPAALRQAYDHPAILYLMGELTQADGHALAIVGTRRPSIYGQALAAKITPILVEHGLTIVSGLAVGIDTVGHRHALQAGGRTIAVLGSGLDVIYPSQNRSLAARIAENGAVVTEYPLGTQPDAFNFPARNRIISGLSMGTLVIEAGEKSGALLTARFALDQNREVFAFPGRISDVQSAGCNTLIKRGQAKLVTGPDDILDELDVGGGPRQLGLEHDPAENETERKLLALLSGAPVHVDELGRQASMPAAQVTSALTMLELRGVIRHVGSMHYVLSR